MPDGHLLIKAGPEIGSVGSFVHGAGGADPVTHLRFFDVDKDMEFREALSLTNIIDGINLISQDFTISLRLVAGYGIQSSKRAVRISYLVFGYVVALKQTVRVVTITNLAAKRQMFSRPIPRF